MLTTIECSMPGSSYGLFEASVPRFAVHLGADTKYGVGPCICGFDRFQRDENGRMTVGFSVGGGFSGPTYTHEPCPECTALIDGRPVHGLHADLFPTPAPAGVSAATTSRDSHVEDPAGAPSETPSTAKDVA